MTNETQIYFDLGLSLAVRDVTLSNYFRDLHGKFSMLGQVVSVPDESYRQALADSLLYFRSGSWTGGPEIGRVKTARLNKGSRRP